MYMASQFSIKGLLKLGKDTAGSLNANSTSSTVDESVRLDLFSHKETSRNNATNLGNGESSMAQKEAEGGEATTVVQDDDHQRVSVSNENDGRSSQTLSRRKRKRIRPVPSRTAAEQEQDSMLESESNYGEPAVLTPESKAESIKDSKSAVKRHRTAFTKEQYYILEFVFYCCNYPDSYLRRDISKATGIDEPRIQVWFQNRRAKHRKREMPLQLPQRPSTLPASLSPQVLQASFTGTAARLAGPSTLYTPYTTMPAVAYPPLPAACRYPSATNSPMDLMVTAAETHAARKASIQETASTEDTAL